MSKFQPTQIRSFDQVWKRILEKWKAGNMKLILFLFLQKNSSNEIKLHLDAAYSDPSPLLASAENYCNEFDG